MEKIALFDVCHTLVNTSTIREFTEDYLLSSRHNTSFKLLTLLRHYAWKIARRLHLVNHEIYRKHFFKLYKGYSKAELEILGEKYAEYLLTVIKDEILVRLKNLQQEGFTIYLVSAALDIYLNPLAKKLGVSIVCTELQTNKHGYYNGFIDGIEPYRIGKVEKLKQLIGDKNIDWEHSIAFGDAVTDIPVLSLVGKSCVVDPDTQLSRHAQSYNWEVIITAKKTKILLVTTSDKIAGAEKTIFDVLRLIDRKRFLPKLVVFKRDLDGELIERVKELGVTVDCLGIQSKWQFYRLAKFCYIIKKFKPDILESFLFFDNQVARVFGWFARVSFIISGQQNAYAKRSFLRNIIDRITIRFADKIISNSRAGKDWYTSRHYCTQDHVVVIPSGIDIEQLHELQSQHAIVTNPRTIFGITIPNNSLAAVSIGFLTEQKGFDYLIRAARFLKNDMVPVHFFIIGDGPLRESLELLSLEEGVSDIIHFVGFQSGAAQYLDLFDLFVLSSLWEGMPNVVIEAMASRIPIVATNVGGVSELITNKEGGILVEPKNIKLLADGIKTMMYFSQDDRNRIAAHQYERVLNHFSASAMVQAREEIYEQFLER